MIEGNAVSFTYPDGKIAIDNISFKIGEKDSVGVVGGNGAGKSTLLLLIVGIYMPKGRIIIDGEEVNKTNLKSIREKVGMVFQNPDDQLFMNKVYDDIAFGPTNYGVEEEIIACRVNKVMEKLKITNLRDRSPSRLSGGEKRKVAIASVLSMEPKVLIFDEPTSFLDPKGKKSLVEIISEIEGTKIIVSHDLEMIMNLCNKVIVLKGGKIMASGDTEEILRNENLMEECDLYVPIN